MGIPKLYATDYALPFHVEEQDLIEIGKNIYGKPQLAFSKIAFEWLQQHGRNYGFSLSYPKNIKNKIAYEPWHWACL
ncbi:MAG: D-alanyl-D-alanine carboxypeptidase family protein [Gammaproteobacteria bacterium]|nr:D-alanyl-D-alanine carboxypeptidase family protein [Gammaproteobacteria bacterium]